MLHPVRHIRARIASIPDIFFPFDPDETFWAHESAFQLWNQAETVWPETDFWLWEAGVLAANIEDAAQGSDAEGGTNGVPSLEDLFQIGGEIDEAELAAQLGAAVGGPTAGRVRHLRGVEALAWYVPFHARDTSWGIYLPLSSIAYIAVEVLGRLDADLETRMRLAFRTLHQHELFHFATEYMSSQWEAMLGVPCYQPARSLKDPIWGCIVFEEALANANLLRGSRRRVAGGTTTLRRWVLQMPPGYQDGHHYIREEAFRAGCEQLAARYISCTILSGSARLEAVNLFPLFPLTPTLDWRYCPVHLIRDETRLNLSPLAFLIVSSLAFIEEPAPFRKMLRKQPQTQQQSWEDAKSKLAVSTAFSSLGIERWDYKKSKRKPVNKALYEGKDVYSVKLSGGYRVHLEILKDGTARALEVGSHRDLGHG